MPTLEELVLKDMQEWIRVKLLNDEISMFEYLEEFSLTNGVLAASNKLEELVQTYWDNHLGL